MLGSEAARARAGYRAVWVLCLCWGLAATVAHGTEPDPSPATGRDARMSCAQHLVALAKEGAAKVVAPWRFLKRRRLAHDIAAKIEAQYGPPDRQTRDRIEIAVAVELAEYEKRIAQGMPPRAIWAFVLSGFAAGGIWGMKSIVPKDYHGLIDIFMLGYGLRMGQSAGSMIWDKIDSFWRSWSATRRSAATPPDPTIAEDLKRVAQIMPGKVPPFFEGPLSKFNGSLMIMSSGLAGAALVGEVIGDREDAALLVAEYVRVYIEHYPMFEPYERLLTDGWRTILERLGANRRFRERVYQILVHERRYPLDRMKVRLVLNAWMPSRADAPDRGLGPPAQAALFKIQTIVHAGQTVHARLGDEPCAARLLAQAAKLYLQHFELFSQYEPLLSADWLLVTERLDAPGFRDEVRRLVQGDDSLRIDAKELEVVLDRLLPPARPAVEAAA